MATKKKTESKSQNADLNTTNETKVKSSTDNTVKSNVTSNPPVSAKINTEELYTILLNVIKRGDNIYEKYCTITNSKDEHFESALDRIRTFIDNNKELFK